MLVLNNFLEKSFVVGNQSTNYNCFKIFLPIYDFSCGIIFIKQIIKDTSKIENEYVFKGVGLVLSEMFEARKDAKSPVPISDNTKSPVDVSTLKLIYNPTIAISTATPKAISEFMLSKYKQTRKDIKLPTIQEKIAEKKDIFKYKGVTVYDFEAKIILDSGKKLYTGSIENIKNINRKIKGGKDWDTPIDIESLIYDGIPEFEKRVYKLIDNQPETPPSQPIITDDVNEDLKDLLDKKKKQKKEENQPPPPPTNDIIVPPENGDIIQIDKNKFGLVESVVDGKIRFRTLTKKQAATILNERAKG